MNNKNKFAYLIFLILSSQAILTVLFRHCYGECQIRKGIAAYQQGNLATAEKHFRDAAETNPSLVEAYNNLGVVSARQNNLEKAIAAFQLALKIAPNYGSAQANLGFALEKQGNLKAAVNEYTKKLPAAPDPKRSSLSLEMGLPEGRGVLSEKIAQYKQEIKFKPGDWTSYYNLGVALDQQGDLPGAIAAYRETIRLHPNFAEAYGNLGNALVLNGQKTEGINYLKQCRDLFQQQNRPGDVSKAEELIKRLQ